MRWEVVLSHSRKTHQIHTVEFIGDLDASNDRVVDAFIKAYGCGPFVARFGELTCSNWLRLPNST